MLEVGYGKKVFAKSYVWLMLLIMYAPILTLIVFSFTESKNIGSWTGFSFKLYRDMFKNEEIVTALVNTIIVAVSAGIVSTILGTLGAIGIYYCTPKAKRIMNGLSQIPVMNAEIVTAISLTILFVSFGVKFNFFYFTCWTCSFNCSICSLECNAKIKTNGSKYI